MAQPADVHIDVYYRHSDDYPPAQIMMAVLQGECDEETLSVWLEEAEAAVEDEEDEGVYRVSLAGHEAGLSLEVIRVAALDQTVALVCVSATQGEAGDVEIHDAHIDPLIAAVDPAVMDGIAARAAEAVDALDAEGAEDGWMWVFVAL